MLGVRAGVASHSLSLYLVAWVWGMLPVSPGCDHVLLGCHPSCSHPTRLSHTLCLMRKRVSFGTTGYLAAAQGDNGAAELWDERCEGSMCIAGAHTAMSEPSQSHSPPLPGPGSRSSKPCVSPKTASGAAGRKGSTAGLGDVLMGRGVAPAGLGTKAGPALPDMGLCAGLCQGTSLRDSGALSWGGWPPPAVLDWAGPVLGAGRVLATTEKAEKQGNKPSPKKSLVSSGAEPAASLGTSPGPGPAACG